MPGQLSFFHIRLPLLSIEQLLFNLENNSLLSLLMLPNVKEGIRLASPSFFKQMNATGSDKDIGIQEAVLKYLLRMSTRCTPFGFFAGVATGYIKNTTIFDLSQSVVTTSLSLDWRILAGLYEHFLNMDCLRLQMLYYPNNSIYMVGSKLRFTEKAVSGKDYFLSEINDEPHINRVLVECKNGQPFGALINCLTRNDISTNDAEEFITSLIADGILVSELNPSVFDRYPLSSLIGRLEKYNGLDGPLKMLKVLESCLLSRDNVHESISKAESIISQMLSHPTNNPVLKCDLNHVGQRVSLNGNVTKGLKKDFEKLAALSQKSNKALDLFRIKFYERYQEQEIPILNALDEISGVGYDQEPEDLSHDEVRPILYDDLQRNNELVIKLYNTWLSGTADFVEISDQDLSGHHQVTETEISSYYVLGYFLSKSEEALDKGHYQFVLNAMAGPSAYQLLGRFCHSDPDLEAMIRNHLEIMQQNNPDIIYAEVGHLPNAYSGNVLQRPAFYNFQIPYISRSDISDAFQLNLQDLCLSVPFGEKLVLRSKKLNKQVVPCITAAHNYNNALPIYRFLGDLQKQNNFLAIQWDWGILDGIKRLPRVQYKKIVLKPAQWKFSISDVDSAMSVNDIISDLRSKWQLPRFIAVSQADQELFLDLNSEDCAKLFVSTLQRIKTLTVVEWLRTPENCFLKGPNGNHTHEIVLSYVNDDISYTNKSSREKNYGNAQRIYMPGEQWLYIKAYCHHKTISSIAILVSELLARFSLAGKIQCWYFIRYKDPASHIRIRVKLADSLYFGNVLQGLRLLVSESILSGEISQFMVCTYERELERYGSEIIDTTELFFGFNSILVVEALQVRTDEDSCVIFSIIIIKQYFDVFNLGIESIVEFTGGIVKKYFHDRPTKNFERKKIAEEFGEKKKKITDLLLNRNPTESDRQFQHYASTHLESVKPLANEVLEYFANKPELLKMNYIKDLIHMFVNRLFEVDQNEAEIKIYYFLSKAYKTLLLDKRYGIVFKE